MLKIQKPKTFGEFLKQTLIVFLTIIGIFIFIKYRAIPLIDRSMIAAAANGDYEGVKLKLDYFYADVNARSKNGGTALHAAANIGDAKIAELLLSHGADTNMTIDEQDEYAALVFAINNHKYDVARLILAKGVNPTIATTALRQFACETCSLSQIELIPVEIKKEIGEELIRQGADIGKAIRSAVRSNNIVILDMLISHGADLNNSYDSFSQCIMFEANSPTMINYLIKHGVDVNCLNLGDYSTALFNLEYSESERRMQITLSTNYAKQDKDNNTTVLEGLLKAGANPNARDKKGNTPLFVLDKAEQIAMLLRYGANANIKNKMGQIPYEYHLHQSGPRRTEILTLLNKLNQNKPNKEKRWY